MTSDDVAVHSKCVDLGVAQVPATAEQVRQLIRVEVDKAKEERKESEKLKCNIVTFWIKEDGKRDKEKIRKLFRVCPVSEYTIFIITGHKRKGNLRETGNVMAETYYEFAALFKIPGLAAEFTAR